MNFFSCVLILPFLWFLDGPLLNTGGVPQPTQPFGGPRGPLGIDQPNTLAQVRID